MLWSKKEGILPSFCMFVYQEGTIDFKTPPHYKWPVKCLKEGNFIGDFPSVVAKQEFQTEAVCIKDCMIIQVQSSHLLQFLSKNPGMKLLMREEYIIY